MHAYYQDIKSRIKDPILWYDCNGVPRYDKFTPELSPNIYAEEVLLVEISCQDCRSKFLVEFNWSMIDRIFDRHAESFTTDMREWLKRKPEDRHMAPLHYGDPPAHGCVGDTMNCYDLRIVEFWRKCKDKFGFERISEYEIELEKED